MAFLDMFDKLDDIIYKPVETICDFIKEPLRVFEHKREMQRQQVETQRQQMNIEASERANASARAHELNLSRQTAENEAAQKRLDQELVEQERESARVDLEARAKIDADTRRWNAEIDQMILEQEDARRERLVECLKRYQIDLATATRDIVESIGMMSLSLRERANQMVLEKTKEYRAMQYESSRQSALELKEAQEMFADDPETFQILRDAIMSERADAVELASRFIVELSEDIKRLDLETTALLNDGWKNINKYLSPMADRLGVTLANPDEMKKLETTN
ncbi:hypothetical protein [Ruminococcus callidus]|uniref:hypothetical protein n=1 Tax=Ruminococcus callidus TaxID=40519 RepID=UPI0039A06BF2